MSPSEGTIVPALPLSNVPPSPRSDVSATTEPSQNSDQSVDRITTRMSQISLSPQSPIRTPWISDPSKPFPKSRRWHRKHASRIRGSVTSSRPPSSSNASTAGFNDATNHIIPTPTTTAPTSPLSPAIPKSSISTPAKSTPQSQSSSITTSPTKSPTPRPPPKSWSALVSQNTKPAPSSRQPLPVTKLANGKMAGLGAALASFDPFSVASTVAPVIRPRGLINTGNLCFMNVVLQALLYCPPFYNLLDTIRRHVVHKIASQTPLLDSLIDFLREFEVVDPTSEDANPNGPVVGQEHIKDFGDPFIPERVYNGWKGNKDFERMKRGNQEDAEEFLGLLLNAVHDEFLNAFKTLPAESQQVLNDHYEVQIRNGVSEDDVHVRVNSVNSEDGWQEIGPRQKVSITRTQLIVESPITRIFTGNLRSILRKPGNKDSITLEPYRPLQLDIQDPHVRSVTDALRHLTATEVLNPDYDGTGRAMTRRSFIEKLPPILILHFKRFVYNDQGTKKVWKKIAYPLTLDIPLDVLSPLQRGETPPQFQLFGVIYHHGTSATGGHYTADVLLQDGRTWLNLDDTKLKWINASDVAVSENDGNYSTDLDQMNGVGDDSIGLAGWDNGKSKVAYILLYKRVHL